MDITTIRKALAKQLDELGDVRVFIAPTQFGSSFGAGIDEVNLLARITVDGSDAEERIDELFSKVPDIVAEDRSLGGVVSDADVKSCTGHKFYPRPEQWMPPVLGAEWSVTVQM